MPKKVIIRAGKRTHLIRPFPDGNNQMQAFYDNGIIAIAWPDTGDLSGMTREEIKELLSDEPHSLTGLNLGNSLATLNLFVNNMKIGEKVLVANGSEIYIAEIVGDYEFNKKYIGKGFPHQRKVTWLNRVPRDMLSRDLRMSLKVHRTAANLSKHSDEIELLAEGKSLESEKEDVDMIVVTYPIRNDLELSFSIPSDITKAEAERLSIYFKSLYFAE